MPVVHVLHEAFEIEKGFMTTIHAFTSDQRILDNSHKDPRRARAASQSIVPTSTGASKAIGEIIPSLKGKLEGIAMRVPTPNVSLVELVFCTKKNLSVEKINLAFQKFIDKQDKKILEITNEKLVSVDFNHNSASSIIDASLTNVVEKNMGKISAWYDNEWGFSNRMCDIAEYLQKFIMNYIKNQKELNGKIVLLRLDLNVPITNGKITDETRINKILPIFRYLIDKKSKIVVISHIGRQKEKKIEKLSLKPIYENLKKLDKKIKLVTDDIFELNKEKLFNSPEDQIVFLENIRFYKEKR